MTFKNFTPVRIIILFLIISTVSLLLNPTLVKKIFESPEPVRIYFADHISQAYAEVIKKFNEENKGKIEVIPIHVAFEKFTTNERKEILSRNLRGNDVIDIFAVDLIWIENFSKWGTDLTEFFNENSYLQLNSKVVDACKVNGMLAAIPINIDAGIMYYRKDILRKLPDYEMISKKLLNSVTWEEFIRLSERKELQGHPFYIFPADDYEGLVCSYFEILNQLERGTGILDFNPESVNSVKAIEFISNLVNHYKISPPDVVNLRELSGFEYFINHDAVFLKGWPSLINDSTTDFYLNQKQAEIDVMPLPHIAGSDPSTILGGWPLMISKYSKHKKEAWEFIKFLLREDIQKKIYIMRKQIPVNMKLLADADFVKSHPEITLLIEAVNKGSFRPFRKDYSAVSEILSKNIYLAIKQKQTPHRAAKNTALKMNSNDLIFR